MYVFTHIHIYSRVRSRISPCFLLKSVSRSRDDFSTSTENLLVMIDQSGSKCGLQFKYTTSTALVQLNVSECVHIQPADLIAVGEM